MTDTELEIASIHEAAHAVFARYFQWSILKSIEIGVGDPIAGQCWPVLPRSKRISNRAARKNPALLLPSCEQKALILSAGPMAQELYCGAPAFFGSSEDMIELVAVGEVVARILCEIQNDRSEYGSFHTKFIENVVQVTWRMLNDAEIRDTVHIVAKRLRESGSIKGRAARVLIDRHLREMQTVFGSFDADGHFPDQMSSAAHDRE